MPPPPENSWPTKTTGAAPHRHRLRYDPGRNPWEFASALLPSGLRGVPAPQLEEVLEHVLQRIIHLPDVHEPDPRPVMRSGIGLIGLSDPTGRPPPHSHKNPHPNQPTPRTPDPHVPHH